MKEAPESFFQRVKDNGRLIVASAIVMVGTAVGLNELITRQQADRVLFSARQAEAFLDKRADYSGRPGGVSFPQDHEPYDDAIIDFFKAKDIAVGEIIGEGIDPKLNFGCRVFATDQPYTTVDICTGWALWDGANRRSKMLGFFESPTYIGTTVVYPGVLQ